MNSENFNFTDDEIDVVATALKFMIKAQEEYVAKTRMPLVGDNAELFKQAKELYEKLEKEFY